MSTFHSNGKLLLTGEYVVLDGALSLAIPTQYGQTLEVQPFNDTKILWQSFDENNSIWFESTFNHHQIVAVTSKQGQSLSDRLIHILHSAKQLNPSFLNSDTGYHIKTKLDFPKNWGLGTSSTLINNIAKWANVDPYKLLELTFGGSGYDIACAQHNGPITYQLLINTSQSVGNEQRKISKVNFNPKFKDHLFFVHLNKKQNSYEEIAKYQIKKNISHAIIEEISKITGQLISCESLESFEDLMTTHEHIISKVLNRPPVKELMFKDYPGCIKSLGAWGGDFVLVTAKDVDPMDYFKSRGYTTLIPYTQMVLQP